MKLLKRFRKQGSGEDVETQAARELDAAVNAAKPADADGMVGAMPAPAPPDSAPEVTAGPAADSSNGDAAGSVTDLPARRPSAPRKTKSRATASTGTATPRTRAAGAKPTTPRAKTSETPATATGPTKAPVRKAKKPAAGASSGTAPAPARKPRTTGTTGVAKKSPGRPRAGEPAAKKR